MRLPPALLVLGMGGAGGVMGVLHPIILLPLTTGIRKDEGVQGRGVLDLGSGGVVGGAVGLGGGGAVGQLGQLELGRLKQLNQLKQLEQLVLGQHRQL